MPHTVIHLSGTPDAALAGWERAAPRTVSNDPKTRASNQEAIRKSRDTPIHRS